MITKGCIPKGIVNMNGKAADIVYQRYLDVLRDNIVYRPKFSDSDGVIKRAKLIQNEIDRLVFDSKHKSGEIE